MAIENLIKKIVILRDENSKSIIRFFIKPKNIRLDFGLNFIKCFLCIPNKISNKLDLYVMKQEGMTFEHDFCYFILLFSSLLKKEE